MHTHVGHLHHAPTDMNDPGTEKKPGFGDGHTGGKLAIAQLYNAHNQLAKKVAPKQRPSNPDITEKIDGSPSVFFGYHPSNGKPFVATKGLSNKTSKFAQTKEDIQKHYGHAPGLARSMEHALTHLPKIIKDKSKVYQGDLMYHPGSISTQNNEYHFKPNLLRYHVPVNSEHGQRIAKSKIGIAVHTQYDANEGHPSTWPVSHPTEFPGLQDHPHVNQIGLGITHYDDHHYLENHRREFHEHMEGAKVALADAEHSHKPLQKINAHMKMYANHANRNGERPTSDGFKNFMIGRKEKGRDSLKKHNEVMQHAHENSHHMDRVFTLQHHLEKAKDIMVTALGSRSVVSPRTTTDHPETGKTIGMSPEGHVTSKVVTHPETGEKHKVSLKFVSSEFADLNTRKNNKSLTEWFMLDEDLDTKGEPHDLAVPHTDHHYSIPTKTGVLTAGHERPVAAAIAHAAKNGHGPEHVHIYVSASYRPGPENKKNKAEGIEVGDPPKNPIKPEDKLSLTREAVAHHGIPKENVHLAQSPVRAIMQRHEEAPGHTHVFVGGDRQEKLEQAGSYLKHPDEFHVHALPRGEDSGKLDASNISASSVRKLARDKKDISQYMAAGIRHRAGEYAQMIRDGGKPLKETYILSRLRSILNESR